MKQQTTVFNLISALGASEINFRAPRGRLAVLPTNYYIKVGALSKNNREGALNRQGR